MKTTIIMATVAITAFASFKLATNWYADTKQAKIEFKIIGPMGDVKGSFSGLKANINFDPANPATASITASVDVNTIETGIGLRNKDLREKEEWFNAAKYPAITIKSRKIERVGAGYKMDADVTIKGVTRPVTIPFSFIPSGNGGTFQSEFTINREDFGVGKSGGSVKQDVTVTLYVPVAK